MEAGGSAVIALLLLLLQATDWTSMRTNTQEVLNGSFSSCPDGDDGAYGEKVYTWKPHDKVLAEIHLGPREEFAVFAGEVPEERDHRGADNLLSPAYQYGDVISRTGRNWAIPSLHLHMNVRRAPGSFESCYSYWILVESVPYTAAER